jgi:hypothetical protein
MFFGKDVRVLLKRDANKSFKLLNKKNDKVSISLVNSIKRNIEILKNNPQFGEPMGKKRIPKKFKKMGINNLYRIELPNYWRMIYTIEGTRVEIFLFVLRIFDHKDYNKLFGYN